MKVKSLYQAELKLTRQLFNEDATLYNKISSSRDAFCNFQEILKKEELDLELAEYFAVIGLNRSNKVIHYSLISIGGMAGTVADGKIIFKSLLLSNCTGFILCHNHPSGNKQPSEQDKRLTRDLKAFGKLIDLELLDHIILAPYITGDGCDYLSFADEGIL